MADQLEAILAEGLTALSLPYTDDTLRRFRLFYTLLSERSQQMNLTARFWTSAAVRASPGWC